MVGCRSFAFGHIKLRPKYAVDIEETIVDG